MDQHSSPLIRPPHSLLLLMPHNTGIPTPDILFFHYLNFHITCRLLLRENYAWIKDNEGKKESQYKQYMKTKEQRWTNVGIKREREQKQMMKRSCCSLWVHLDTRRPSPQINYNITITAGDSCLLRRTFSPQISYPEKRGLIKRPGMRWSSAENQ